MRDDWLDVLRHVPKGRTCHANLMAFHPVHISLERIDLTVVGQHAERLGQPPLWKCIGGIALMIDCKSALKTFILKVRVKHRHLFCQHHSFIDDGTTRH